MFDLTSSKLLILGLVALIAYGPPTTEAVATVPALASVTLSTVLPLTRPTEVNAESAGASPKNFALSLAVIVSAAGLTVSCPGRNEIA